MENSWLTSEQAPPRRRRTFQAKPRGPARVKRCARIPRCSFAQGGVQNRVPPNVYPVVLLRWNVAGLAAGIEAGRHILLRVFRLEQRPAPALGIQGVLGESLDRKSTRL